MPDHPSKLLDTEPKPERVIIRPYPKVVVYYPTMIMAFLCAALAYFSGDADGNTAALAGRIFFLVFFFNTLTIAFDFTRAVFVAMCLLFALLVTLGFLVQSYDISIFKYLGVAFKWFDFSAKPTFFLGYGLAFVIIFVGVFVQTRFDYWEVKHNELLHHHGIAGDVERYPAPNLRMSKEITDVFEYFLLFSGRLVLYPKNSDRPIVLDHVVRINAMEKRVEKMLQTLQVRLEHQGPSAAPPPPPAG